MEEIQHLQLDRTWKANLLLYCTDAPELNCVDYNAWCQQFQKLTQLYLELGPCIDCWEHT